MYQKIKTKPLEKNHNDTTKNEQRIKGKKRTRYVAGRVPLRKLRNSYWLLRDCTYIMFSASLYCILLDQQVCFATKEKSLQPNILNFLRKNFGETWPKWSQNFVISFGWMDAEHPSPPTCAHF